MTYRTPNHGEIKTPNLDYLTGKAVTNIYKITGTDPFNLAAEGRIGELTAVLGWWAALQLPEYQGITYEQVQEWPLVVFDMVELDDDADDVREAAADLATQDDEAVTDLINGETGHPFTEA